MVLFVQQNRRRQRSNNRTLFLRFPTLCPIPEDTLHPFPEPEQDKSSVFDRSPTNVRTIYHKTLPKQESSQASLVFEGLMLIDQERRQNGLLPFQLSPSLSYLATHQAQIMASSGSIFHSVATIDELTTLLSSSQVAENIQRGDSLRDMHEETMNQQGSTINRFNVLSEHFTQFGCGYALGMDGKLYCCHLFRK